MTGSVKFSDLEWIKQQAHTAPDEYQYKAILFIGSESYDAPTITVLQGLQALGWTVYTLHKPNINSWFINTVIDDPHEVKFDFVLSNIHWGTRWSYYNQYNLHDCLCVLIDGDDDRGRHHWRTKYEEYLSTYHFNPPDTIKDLPDNMPYRWVEPLGDYEPDVVFTSQANHGDTYYLPFGIHNSYFTHAIHRPHHERRIDFAHFPGAGIRRGEMTIWLKKEGVPGNIHNGHASGVGMLIGAVSELAHADFKENIHSWHRWFIFQDYYKILNDTKYAIYPGCTQWYWESKRPFEILASGCLFLMLNPGEFTAQYPIQQLWPFGFYDTKEEFLRKAKTLIDGWWDIDENLRLHVHQRALRYFTPEPIARYFLWKILQ